MESAFASFTFWLFVIGPLFCLGLCMWVNRQDRRDGYLPDAPSGFYFPGAVMAVMLLVGWASKLHAQTVIRDGCELLEPWSMVWLLAGCFWNN